MDPATGGVARTLRNLLPELTIIGIDSEVLCFDDPSLMDVGLDEGCLIHRIGPSSGSWGRVSGFERWLDAHADGFDVVVLHGLWLYNGYSYTKWMRGRRKISGRYKPRTWVIPHGMLDPWFQQAEGRRLKSIRNFIYWWLIEKDTIASANLLIFTSESERKKAAVTFPGFRPRDTAVLQLGVPDPFEMSPADAGLDNPYGPKDRGFILALGRVDPKKGFDLLPEVWMRLQRDEYYHYRLPHLLIAGPGWETTYGQKLKARIRKSELGNRISTRGMLQGMDKWHALRSCDALIMPSHQENFGLVAAEALACGTPVMLSDQVDIHPLIVGGNAGMSDNDSVDGMERLLRKWLDLNMDERQQMKVSARHLFMDQFDIRKTARRFRELLEEKVK
jgi:glycosyltransferase involved in cell wall biosynthesis